MDKFYEDPMKLCQLVTQFQTRFLYVIFGCLEKAIPASLLMPWLYLPGSEYFTDLLLTNLFA